MLILIPPISARYAGHGETPCKSLSEMAEALKEANGGHWGALAGHDVEDWWYEIGNDDTRLGYWEWAANRIDSGEFD